MRMELEHFCWFTIRISLDLFFITMKKYLNTPFLVPGIKSNVKKKVSGLVPLLYMYLIDTKFETFFFNLGLISETINGILR